MGQHWKAEEEFDDNQKVNGLPLPRVIQSSAWSQNKNIGGCDPLALPLSKLLHHGSENFCLRKLASGIAQLRSRGIDLTQAAQQKAVQDGLTLDNPAAIQHFTKIIADQLQGFQTIRVRYNHNTRLHPYKLNLLL